MNAVIYARYSSENQRDESIDGQLRECDEFARRKGYTIVKTYADRALSGKRADNRPEFMQMIYDSAKGEFDTVIVWKIDRFSRDKYDSANYKNILKKNNVSVISATEPIDDSPEGALMEAIFEGFSVYYVKDLEQKISRGMTENAINGKFNGGSLTYGYFIDENKRFQIDPVTAPVVVEIFKRYASGENIKHIADDLNSKGIFNRGRAFTYHFMNGLLKNRRYIGEYVFRDTINTTAIPRIITQELFDKCQQRIDSNRQKPASFKPVEDKYLLTGKIFCGYCGKSMSGVSGTSKTQKIHRYYQCVNSRKRACGNKRVSKVMIESIVINYAMRMSDDTVLINQIIDTCYELQRKESSQLGVLKGQLKQTQKQLDNVVCAIANGINAESVRTKLEQLEQEKKRLEIQIAQEQIERPIISKEQIAFWIMKFAKANFKSAEEKQALIDIFINSIYIYEDRAVIFFNYKDGEKCVSFDNAQNIIKKTNTRINECSSFVSSGGA